MYETSWINGSEVKPTNQSLSLSVKNNQSTTELALIIVAYLMLMVAIICGNGLVLAAFAYERRLRTMNNILIIGISVADLLVGLILLPYWTAISAGNQLHNRQISREIYHLYITSDIFLSCASVLQLTSLSVERCHATLFPFKHRILTRKTFYIAMAAAWLYAALIAALEPVQYGRWETIYTIVTMATCFLLPFIIISVSYIIIFRVTKAANRNTNLSRNSRKQSAVRKERRLSLTGALISLLFVIMWLPLFGMTVVATCNPQLLPDAATTSRLLFFVKWMHYSNSCVDPILYSYRSPRIKSTIYNMLYRLLGRKDLLRRASWTSGLSSQPNLNLKQTSIVMRNSVALREMTVTSNQVQNKTQCGPSVNMSAIEQNNNGII